MDVLQIFKPKIKPLKASYSSLTFKHKLIIMLVLASLANFVIPHEVAAFEKQETPRLIFTLGDHTEFLEEINYQAMAKRQQDELLAELARKQELIRKVQAYLRQYNSPLIDSVPILVTLKNWKQILALSNAESSFCRRYPQSTANCWGVGGENLWDMGDNLTEGVVAMNHFLENHPRRSKVKYSQMTFGQMNGLYKQPPGDHWVLNNQSVYNDLIRIEQSI